MRGCFEYLRERFTYHSERGVEITKIQIEKRSRFYVDFKRASDSVLHYQQLSGEPITFDGKELEFDILTYHDSNEDMGDPISFRLYSGEQWIEDSMWDYVAEQILRPANKELEEYKQRARAAISKCFGMYDEFNVEKELRKELGL